jgi:hypothetical protein
VNLKQLSNIPPWEWPENAATLILEMLANRKASANDRLLAAELAGEEVILDDKIGKALLGIVKSSEEPVELRAEAAIALGPALEEAELGDYEDTDDSPSLSKSFVQEIQRTFHQLYSDTNVPGNLRRSVLESSVRNLQNWHADAIRSAYESDNRDWRLTAVFCMEFVRGFEGEIVESLKSNDSDILFHAVKAAGNWEIDAAWPKIARLVTSPDSEKNLLLAAIEAAACIRPTETDIIEPLVDSEDEDISEAAMDALSEAEFAQGDSETEEEEDDDNELDENDDKEDE